MNCPIHSHCPPTQTAYFSSEPLSREVCGWGVTHKKKTNFTLMWTTTHVPADQEEFRPNHFVLLKQKRKNITKIDCTQEDSRGEEVGARDDWDVDVGSSDGVGVWGDCGVGGVSSGDVGLASFSDRGVVNSDETEEDYS
ncbi:hypothetical protein ElyMa_005598700 [Elysia marginata]|uniref:Uncharacterized protein n=1 Tax=Elysia marginata TaxID=1093978 RepID=A0AAV4F450_9GAST|nr:hypothetical protein ElyMa_005598700 [Elysia marginata]